MPAVLIAVPPKIDWSGLEADELLRERSPLPCGARRARNQDNTLTAGRLFHQYHVLIFGLVVWSVWLASTMISRVRYRRVAAIGTCVTRVTKEWDVRPQRLDRIGDHRGSDRALVATSRSALNWGKFLSIPTSHKGTSIVNNQTRETNQLTPRVIACAREIVSVCRALSHGRPLLSASFEGQRDGS